MPVHLHLNPLGGLAGDMFCAALLDALPAHLEAARHALAMLDMPEPIDIMLDPPPGTIGGKRLRVITGESATDRHNHTHFGAIRALLERSALDAGVRRRALDMFTLLAAAEGRVHGVDPNAVAFHEVGAVDSIADIVCAAALLEAAGVTSASSAPLPLGGGRVKSAHGVLPVPAPATALLLEGMPVVDDGIAGERVTPTGAAILRSLGTLRPASGGRLRSTGMGFGTRDLSGIPNCLQVLVIDEVGAHTHIDGFEQDRVAVIAFEVDDQNPEDLALALDRLRAESGVRSVTTLTGIGKSGRPTMRIELIVEPECMTRTVAACFDQTTTIGLRWQEVQRVLLPRRETSVRLGEQEVAVKIVERPSGQTAKTEARAVTDAPNQAAREHIRTTAARCALEDKS